MYAVIGAAGEANGKGMKSYLIMMAVRLMDIHRLLKPTGSLYLHCDPTASHYLKTLMDAIFGPRQFRNEVVWKRTSSHNRAKRWGPIHDTILFYSAGPKFTWNRVLQPLEALLHDSTAARVGALFQLLVQDTTAQDFGLPSSAIRLRM